MFNVINRYFALLSRVKLIVYGLLYIIKEEVFTIYNVKLTNYFKRSMPRPIVSQLETDMIKISNYPGIATYVLNNLQQLIIGSQFKPSSVINRLNYSSSQLLSPCDIICGSGQASSMLLKLQ